MISYIGMLNKFLSSAKDKWFLLLITLIIGIFIGQNGSKKDYWSGVYYPEGNLAGNAIYSPRFDLKEECIGWAMNERGKSPQDKEIDLQDLWECNKNCRLEDNYKFLVHNNKQYILEGNNGPLYVCDDGGFDGGDWIRGDF